MMTVDQATQIIQSLTQQGIEFDSGLTDCEVLDVETKFAFRFPPDLRLFLQTALPASTSFINWRLGLVSKAEANKIYSRLNWPLEGMLFDMKNNSFWLNSWGVKPAGFEHQVLVAAQHYASYPRLIPVYSHRYIPDRPHESGNPIYSVYQTDVIYYGYDLASYFANEFKLELPRSIKTAKQPKLTIDFWSDQTG